MLYSPEKGQYVTRLPHKRDYDVKRRRLTDEKFAAIVAELNARIAGGEVHTSSWIPGSDWTGTVFAPIYDDACMQDERESARFFGLVLWKVMMDHPATWAFGRYEKEGVPIEGLTYFRVEPPA